MKVKLKTSMAGDSFAYTFGDIVDTALFVTKGGRSADDIAKCWIEADIAEIPKSEAVLADDVEKQTSRADAAEEQLDTLREEHEHVAAEREELKAQVAVLEQIVDGDAAAKVTELTAANANLQQQLSEREAQLGQARADASDLLNSATDPQLEALATSLNDAAGKLSQAMIAA